MSTIHYPPADILLDPEDWYVANWRNLPPLPRPAPVLFDLAACCKRLATVGRTDAGHDWSLARIGPCLSPEEGRFWLDAFDRIGKGTPARLAEVFSRRQGLPCLSADECRKRLKNFSARQTPAFLSALASQVDSATLIKLLLEPWENKGDSGPQLPWAISEGSFDEILLTGFRSLVRPWWTPDEIDAARQPVRAYLVDPPRSRYSPGLPDFVLSLMAALGMSAEVEAALGKIGAVGWEFTLFTERQFAVFGLDDPDKVVPTLRRLGLRLWRPSHLRGLLAHLEAAAIPHIRDAILASPNRPEAELLTPTLDLVRRSETAGAMLELTRRSRAPAPAQRWLDEESDLAVAGLLPLVGDEQQGEAAVNFLRGRVRAGLQGLIEQHLQRLSPEIAARVRRALETTAAMRADAETAVPPWFPPAPARKPRLPSWLDPATLPPLPIDGKLLPLAEMTTLLGLLRDAPLEMSLALFAQLKRHAVPRLLDAFAWAIFERWHSGSADAKDKWALVALGHLGGDGVCLPLAALVERWPGKSQHQRAVLGLQCLGMIGTPLALLCIDRLARSSQYTGLQMEAESRIEQVARDRELTRAQLEDRIVPDLGLDAEGYRPLACAGRAYRLTLGTDRQARLLDERRQYLAELPEMGERDDPAEVEAARAEWKLFRDQVREVMHIQAARFERAMLRWRRWAPADFQAFVVRHPLQNHLARAVLWGAFETAGTFRVAFRVTQERTCVDAAGSRVPLDPGWSIGVAHPVLLAPDERMVWSDILGEQGLDLPTWQMGRPTHPLRQEEKGQKELARWRGQMIDYGDFYSHSGDRGYESGAHQRGHLCCRVQYFAPLDVTAYLLHTPIPENTVYDSHGLPIELTGCQFRPGDTRGRVPNANEALTLGEVDPVLLDEVIGDVTGLIPRCPIRGRQ